MRTRILLHDPDAARARALAEVLAHRCDVRVTKFRGEDSGAGGGGGASDDYDIAVVPLELQPGGGLAVAHGLLVSNPTMEVVLYAIDTHSPESEAARSLGIAGVVPVDELPDWLLRSAPLLGQVVRARRTAARCLARLPDLAPKGGRGGPPGTAPIAPLPLHEAERRFRETYLWGVLSRSGSRAEAAARARVPVRTLFQMASKLGIRLEKRRA